MIKLPCKFLWAIIVFLFSSFLNISKSQSVRINEFMALNQSSITDEDSEYSDWIEIYNPTSQSVSLEDWSITDDRNESQKWVFPDVSIAANGYLIIFASGKDRRDTGSELHTNFKLSGAGEYLALFNQYGTVITEFDPFFPEQQTDYSYGYFNNSYIVFSDPTPGEDNEGSTSKLLPPPVFNKNHGFYESSFNLTMTSDVSNTNIYYTTDGSEPSVSNGTLYSSPILIQTTSVIRAVNTLSGEEPSKVTTQTYLFLGDVIHQPNDPDGYPDLWGPYTAIEGTAIGDYEMDPELVGNSTFANSLKDALKSIPTISLVTKSDHFFSRTEDEATGGIYIFTGPPLGTTTFGPGRGWERPVSFEYFDAEGNISLQVDCGVRLQGGHSRRPEKSPKHSFLLVFKSEYGPSRLNYPFFGDEANSDINSITLRGGFGNSWIHHSHDERSRAQYLRDIWSKDTQRAMGHPSSHSEYIHLYINGIYWGIYAPSEKLDKDFAEAYLEGDAEDFDVIKDYAEVADGDINAWNEMMEIANAGLESNEAYQTIQGNNSDGTPDPEIEGMVDVINLIDYMLINFYGGNTDWDHHNWAAMRNRNDPGKGFKFFCWDAEHILKSLYENVVNENNNNCPSHVFQQLRQNADFRRLFADRVQKYCYNGGLLTPESAAERWIARRDVVEKVIIAESARWGDYRRDVHQYQTVGPFDLYTKDDYWLPQQDFMLNDYFPGRTNQFLSQLRSADLFPDVEAPIFNINGYPMVQNTISSGDVLTMSAPEGTIYYTTDGNDPVIWSTPEGSTETELISAVSAKKVIVPKSDIGSTWRSDFNFNDSGWQSSSGSPGGIGYEKGSGYESYISLDVSDDMYTGGSDPNTSCYVRIPFEVNSDDLESFTTLILSIRYDDGFVAYINGNKVAEANAPASLQWNSTPSAGHEASSVETFNISEYIEYLEEGDNLLAIQGLNQSTTSSDFIVMAELIASDQASEGSTSPSAELYSSSITINKSSHIRARSFYNGEWSALTDKFFIIPADFYDLKITEIHYNPKNMDTIGGGRFEFIEIKNIGTSTLDLGGLQFAKGIGYTFPYETELKPGEFIVLASDDDYFYNLYGFPVFDDYKGQLDNNGEKIVLVTNMNDTICSIRYYDDNGWPTKPDGYGFSLVPTEYNPTGDQNLASNWRASYFVGGSPGADDLPDNPMPVEEITAVENVFLSQNYPNPFSDVTYIDYQLPNEAYVLLSIYNMVGQNVKTLVSRNQSAGLYQAEWNGTDHSNNRLKNGIYYYRIEITNQYQSKVVTKKMILMR